jgi:crotonobetainyl-CoA:carnitine CoA-transferase CaiB-like acyl-CoA transferase
MISVELLNNLRSLSRGEKLHILQVLVSELAQEEAQLLRPGGTYPIWSPYDAYEAADALLTMLNAPESQEHAQR